MAGSLRLVESHGWSGRRPREARSGAGGRRQVSTRVRRAGCERIGQMTDVSHAGGWHDEPVVITIRLDAFDPPAGRVSLPDGRELGFVGWLGLLQVLTQLVESAPG